MRRFFPSIAATLAIAILIWRHDVPPPAASVDGEDELQIYDWDDLCTAAIAREEAMDATMLRRSSFVDSSELHTHWVARVWSAIYPQWNISGRWCPQIESRGSIVLLNASPQLHAALRSKVGRFLHVPAAIAASNESTTRPTRCYDVAPILVDMANRALNQQDWDPDLGSLYARYAAARKLRALVESQVDPQSWNRGEPAVVFNGYLILTQSLDNHDQIARLLNDKMQQEKIARSTASGR